MKQERAQVQAVPLVPQCVDAAQPQSTWTPRTLTRSQPGLGSEIKEAGKVMVPEHKPCTISLMEQETALRGRDGAHRYFVGSGVLKR